MSTAATCELLSEGRETTVALTPTISPAQRQSIAEEPVMEMPHSHFVKLKFRESSFLARISARMSACRARSACHALIPDWSASGLLRCSAARLSVCRVVLQIPRTRHARLVADVLARMSREKCCREISDLLHNIFDGYVTRR